MTDKPFNQDLIDSLLEENAELHHLIHLTRQQVISVLMAFIHTNAETSKVPPSWLLANVIANDPSIMEAANTDEWPEGLDHKVNEFCDMMSDYNGDDKLSIPVRAVVEHMTNWPYAAKMKKITH